MSRILIVANRLPATVRVSDDGAVDVVRSVGGVATGLKALHERGGGAWIGWPGEAPKLRRAAREELARRFEEQRLVPLKLSEKEVRRFYEGFSNGVLWPLFHSQITRVPLDARDFDAYRAVNLKYAELTARHAAPGDLVWIHDYQLALMPALLRERAPDVKIGFFLHIPFPSSEIFRVLPWRDEILRGMLGADLVGFHTFSYLRHFAGSLLRRLDLGPDIDRVRHQDRDVRLGVFPMGVDAARFAALGADEEVAAQAAAFRRGGSERILLAIDRLDYTKGIRRRLLAFGRLLDRRPELRGKVRFIQVAVPSRSKVDEYAKFRREVDEMVGRINGAHSTPESAPVHYLHRAFDEKGLAALYRTADVCVVTPLRDGMNLVAKEFVATRVDDDGVLVLSEFAGAAAELGEALIVNPYDVDGSADALGRALDMPREERRARMSALRARVAAWDVERWSSAFISALEATDGARARIDRELRTQDAARMTAALGAAEHLVLFLDYDGTLTGFRRSPELAVPDEDLLSLLRRLAAAPGTTVHLVSGRRRGELEHWFGALPIGLHAEHGLWSRPSPAAPWESTAPIDASWMERVRPFLVQATAGTPGSRLEEKTAGLAWHWRMADPEYGAHQARELRSHLSAALANAPVEVLVGDKVVEVRHQSAHKGVAVARVVAASAGGALVAAIGDDRTDEDLFRALPPDGVAIRVGVGESVAEHRLEDWRHVRSFLTNLAVLRTDAARSPESAVDGAAT